MGWTGCYGMGGIGFSVSPSVTHGVDRVLWYGWNWLQSACGARKLGPCHGHGVTT